MTELAEPLTIRLAHSQDELALRRLADLDSADSVPASPLLVAEVAGELRAALSLPSGEVIADPFHPSAELIDLLRARAAAAVASAPNRLLRATLRRRHGLGLA